MAEERIWLCPDGLTLIENTVRLNRHVQRYGMVRGACYGRVLDVACGCGYGSAMIAANPDVEHVLGVDQSPEAIEYATGHYRTDRCEFACRRIESIGEALTGPVDVLVSLETIEHLDDPAALAQLAARVQCPHVIVSFPTKKSTHYNPFHRHDLTREQVDRLFGDYIAYRRIDLWGEQDVVWYALHPRHVRSWA